MEPYKLIANHNLVVEVFGFWPGFDEAEVHRLLLDSTRRDDEGKRYASIELELRAWNLVEGTPGIYELDASRSSLIHFLFERVYDVEVNGLNHQNVVSSFKLAVVDSQDAGGTIHLAIDLEDCFGLAASFKAASATVLSLKPFGETNAA